MDYASGDSSFIFLKNKNRILMYLRDDKPDIIYPNYWSFIGGKIESDEEPIEALLREIKEEINCDVKDISSVGEILLKNFVYRGVQLSDHTIYFFKGNIDKQVSDINLTEGQRLEYFTFEEYQKLRTIEIFRDFIIKNRRIIFDQS